MGSLNVQLSKELGIEDKGIFETFPIKRWAIDSCMMLVYEDKDVFTEAGICFQNGRKERLIVAAAPAPGAVSLEIPGSNLKLNGEFESADYELRKPVIE